MLPAARYSKFVENAAKRWALPAALRAGRGKQTIRAGSRSWSGKWSPFLCMHGHRVLLCTTAGPSPSAPPVPRSPQFVLPVFKGPNAFENFYVQCQLPIVLFTTLEEYKQ